MAAWRLLPDLLLVWQLGLASTHPLTTCFLLQMSFDHDIMCCVKLKTAKYHLIYSNFLLSEVTPKPLLHYTNLQIMPVATRSPSLQSQTAKIPTQDLDFTSSLTAASAPPGCFSITCFLGSGNWAEGTLSPLPLN